MSSSHIAENAPKNLKAIKEDKMSKAKENKEVDMKSLLIVIYRFLMVFLYCYKVQKEIIQNRDIKEHKMNYLSKQKHSSKAIYTSINMRTNYG